MLLDPPHTAILYYELCDCFYLQTISQTVTLNADEVPGITIGVKAMCPKYEIYLYNLFSFKNDIEFLLQSKNSTLYNEMIIIMALRQLVIVLTNQNKPKDPQIKCVIKSIFTVLTIRRFVTMLINGWPTSNYLFEAFCLRSAPSSYSKFLHGNYIVCRVQIMVCYRPFSSPFQ